MLLSFHMGFVLPTFIFVGIDVKYIYIKSNSLNMPKRKENSVSKVKEINLERGFPTVDVAMNRLKSEVTTAKMSGCKAAIIIHGFGSSGEGGGIKSATKLQIKKPMFRGIIRDTVSGEEWYIKKKEFLNHCPHLKNSERHIDGNQGITVLLLK